MKIQKSDISIVPVRKARGVRFKGIKLLGKKIKKENVSIDKAVSDLIAPVFSYKDLGSNKLLKKCQHGQTQNVNESLNNLIWARCRKRVYVRNSVFRTLVASAVVAYNTGAMGRIPMFKKIRHRLRLLY